MIPRNGFRITLNVGLVLRLTLPGARRIEVVCPGFEGVRLYVHLHGPAQHFVPAFESKVLARLPD